MSNRTKWVGVGLFLLGMVFGAHYLRAAVVHHGITGTTAATIVPEELTRSAGELPVTVIDSYF